MSFDLQFISIFLFHGNFSKNFLALATRPFQTMTQRISNTSATYIMKYEVKNIVYMFDNVLRDNLPSNDKWDALLQLYTFIRDPVPELKTEMHDWFANPLRRRKDFEVKIDSRANIENISRSLPEKYKPYFDDIDLESKCLDSYFDIVMSSYATENAAALEPSSKKVDICKSIDKDPIAPETDTYLYAVVHNSSTTKRNLELPVEVDQEDEKLLIDHAYNEMCLIEHLSSQSKTATEKPCSTIKNNALTENETKRIGKFKKIFNVLKKYSLLFCCPQH